VSVCFACLPGGIHVRLNGRLQHVHERCVLRFNAHHKAEGKALRARRLARRQSVYDRSMNDAAAYGRMLGGRP
jgi:hypothetical protein